MQSLGAAAPALRVSEVVVRAPQVAAAGQEGEEQDRDKQPPHQQHCDDYAAPACNEDAADQRLSPHGPDAPPQKARVAKEMSPMMAALMGAKGLQSHRWYSADKLVRCCQLCSTGHCVR